MPPTLTAISAARILDLPERRSPRRAPLVVFLSILALTAQIAASGGSPASARAAAMFPAGARPALAAQAGESPQMKRLMAIGAAAAMSISGGAMAQNAVEWRVADGGNGHWYVLVDDGADHTWFDARDRAIAAHGHLATLVSEQEDLFVRNAFMPQIHHGPLGPWLGGFQDRQSSTYVEPDGGWAWVTGEPWTWALWNRVGDQEPNNGQCGPEDYLHLAVDVTEGRWNDLGAAGCSGTGNRGAIFEYSADCNNDGLVDYGQILAGDLPDANHNNIPDCCESNTPCGCAGDTNDDRQVDGVDLALILARWGLPASSAPRADCNYDGIINGSDLAIVLGGWGPCPSNAPAWATVLEEAPNPKVVTNASLRAAIVATHRPWRVRDNGTGIEMLLVPPSTFNMGASAGDPAGFPDESPVHAVTLTHAFYLGRFETTQSQWFAKMGPNPSYFQGPNYPDAAQRPVDQVTWNAIQGFLTVTGMRLPTEAEWEFACRAGTTTPTYATGSQVLADIAWYSANSGGQTHAVGGKAANALGCYDMLGNVWEWTADWYGNYSAGAQTDPTGVATGTQRLLRGAPWINDESYCRVSKRGGYWPDNTQNLFGFRVARNP